jgi:nucleoside-diphosphate-sugar epimerase
MKVFLTGATGFIGSALVDRFVTDSCQVSALVRDVSVKMPDAIEPVYGGVDQLTSDNADLNIVLDRVDVVVHAAARAHIMSDEANESLTEYRKVNRDATLSLACLAAESRVKRFVFISSVKVNGELTQSGLPFMPEVNKPPEDPYGLSKYEAEQQLLQIARQTGMEVVIIRPPLVYGPNVKGNFEVMVKWIKKGVPLPLGAVHNQRSLVALDNLVDFIALCADKERSPKAANEVFLISDDKDVSTTELLKKVASAYGVKSILLPIPVWIMRIAAKLLGKGSVADRLFGDLQIDSSKANELLKWHSVITMDEQLKKMAGSDKRNGSL